MFNPSPNLNQGEEEPFMSIVSPFSRSARARQNFNTSKSASASATTNKASRPKARPLPPSSLRGARTERRRNTDVSPETKRRPLLNNTLKGKVKLSPMSVSVNFSYRPMTAPKLPNDLILNDHNSHNSYGDNRHLKSKHRNIHRKQSQTQKSHYSNGQGYNVGQGYYTRYDGNDEAERHNHDIALDRQKSDNTFVHVVQANRLPYSIFSDEKGNTEQYASANKIAAKQAHIIHSASTSLSRHSHAHPRHHPDHTRPNLCTAPSSGDDFHPSPNTMHNRHSKSFSEMKNSNHAPPHNDSIDDGNDIGKTEQANNCHTKSKAHHSSRSHTRDEGALPPMSTDNMNSEESENLANVMELQRALLRKRQQHDRLVIAHKALHERFTAQQTESEENQSSVLLLHTQIDDLRGKLRASIEEHQKCKPMMNAAEKAMGAKQHLNQRIEHLTRQLQQAREENTEFTATKAELAMWKKRYIKSEEKYHPLYALYQELTQEHAPCLSTISHLTDSVEQFQKNIKQISEDRSMLYGEAEKATQKTRELQARISELAPYQPKYELCEKQRKKLDEELEKVRRAHFIVSGDMVRLKSEHKQVQQAAYEVRVQFKALQDTHSYCRDFKPQLDEVSAEREKLIIEKHELMVRLDEALLAHSGCSVIEEELAQTISARDDIEVQYKGTKAALQEVTTSEHKLKATVLALKKDIVDIEEPFARLRKDNKGALEKIIKLQDERVALTAKLASVSKRHKLSVKKSIVANFTIEKHKAKMRNLEKDVLELKQSKTAVASKLERAKEMLSDFGKLKDDMAMHKTINAQLKADLKSSSEKLVEVLKNRNDQIRKFKESHEGSIQALKDKVAEMETESKEMREEMEVTKASESLTKHSLGESHERAVRLHSEILQETENNRTLSKALRDLKKEKAKLVEKTVAQDVELAEMKTLRKTLEVVRESLHQTTMSHEQLVRSSAQLRTEKDRLEEKHVITHRNEQQLTIECGRLKRIVEEHETECPVIEIDYNKIKQDHLVCTQRKAHFEEQEKAWKVIERENERQLTKLSADLERWVEIARINKEKVRMYEEL